MSITFDSEAIMVHHVDRDLSCALRNDKFEIIIGEDYQGVENNVKWAEINLTILEAQTLHDWLCEKLGEIFSLQTEKC